MHKYVKISMPFGSGGLGVVCAIRESAHIPTDDELEKAHAETAARASAESSPGNYGSRQILPNGSQSDAFASAQLHIDRAYPGMRIDSMAGIGKSQPAQQDQVGACIGPGWSCLYAADTLDGIVEHVRDTSGMYVSRAQIIGETAQRIAKAAANNRISARALACIIAETLPRQIGACITDATKRT